MIDIALQGKFGLVSLNDIASRQHISLSYLKQLFSKLRVRDWSRVFAVRVAAIHWEIALMASSWQTFSAPLKMSHQK